MIVDATALPEQVADDVVTSAFRSAGQRCSALAPAVRAGRRRRPHDRDDRRRRARIADRRCQRSRGSDRAGDRRRGETAARRAYRAHEGAGARALCRHGARRQLRRAAYLRTAGCRSTDRGDIRTRSCMWCATAADRLDRVLQSIERSGYGLTLGIHSRIDDTVEHVIDRLSVGNVYVNRNMIGAVVGVQPFGGAWLVGHRPQSRRPELSGALCDRADRDHQHLGRRRQRGADVRSGMSGPSRDAHLTRCVARPT